MKLSCFVVFASLLSLSLSRAANYFADVWNFRFPCRRRRFDVHDAKTIAFSKPRKVIGRDQEMTRENIRRRSALTVHISPLLSSKMGERNFLRAETPDFSSLAATRLCYNSVFISLCMRRPQVDWNFVRGESIYSAVVHFALSWTKRFVWIFQKVLYTSRLRPAEREIPHGI